MSLKSYRLYSLWLASVRAARALGLCWVWAQEKLGLRVRPQFAHVPRLAARGRLRRAAVQEDAPPSRSVAGERCLPTQIHFP